MTKLISNSLQRILVGGALCAFAAAAPIVAPAEARAPAVSPLSGEIAQFYRARGGAALWFAPNAGAAAPQLLQILASAQADNLNPRRYDVRGLARALDAARTGDPAGVGQACGPANSCPERYRPEFSTSRPAPVPVR